MINSLTADSHTNRSLTEMNKVKRTAGNVTLHSQTTGMKSDSVSFNGLAGAKLANDDVFAKLIAKLQGNAEGSVKAKTKTATKALKEITSKAIGAVSDDLSSGITKTGFVDSVINVAKKNPDKLDSKTLDVITKNEDDFKKLLGSAFDYVAEDHKNLNPEKVYEETIKAFKVASDSFGAVQNPKFYQNEKLHNFLNLAQKNQALFDAAYAFILAGFVRPATILATSDKANLENNKYASAHSIASGLIGLSIAALINTPIAKAIGKIKNDPATYLKKDLNYVKKNAKGQLEGKGFDVATKYVNMGVKLALAVPQATVTVALVPIILKNVLGMEKKPKQPAQPVQQVSGGNK